MKKNLITALKIVFFLSIGVLFIWIFVGHLSDEDIKSIFDSFRRANYWWVGLSVIIGIGSHLIRALRWQLLLHPMGYKPGLLNTFFALLIAYFANLALPRLGEVTRCGVLKKYENIPFPNSFGTVIAERALDLLTFAVLFIVNILIQFDRINKYVHVKIYEPLGNKFFFFNDANIVFIIVILLAISLLLFIVVHKKLKKNKLYLKGYNVVVGFWQGLKSLSKVKRPYLFIFYTVIMWAAYFLSVYVCIFSLTETAGLSPLAPFAVLVFGTIGIMLVQGGIGIYPAIAAETLLLYGVTSLQGYAFGWLAWSAQTITIIIFGIISLIVLPVFNRKQKVYANN